MSQLRYAGDNNTFSNLPVDLEQGGTPVDTTTFAKTVPESGLDQPSVGVMVQAKTCTTSKQVVLVDGASRHTSRPPATT